MKQFSITTLLSLLVLAVISQVSAEDKPVADTFPRWSVTGEWVVNHPEWTKTLVFRDDGTFFTLDKNDYSGTWVLTAQKGTPLLVLRWERYATESLDMVDASHFRGQSKPGRWIDMRRANAAKETIKKPATP